MKKTLLKFFTIPLLAVLPMNVWGARSVSGRVVEIIEGKEQPVGYLNVYATGNNKFYTETDDNGYFHFDSFPDNETTITISGVGYTTITPDATTNMGIITINPDISMINDVVVIDCQVSKFKHATSATYDKTLDQCVPTDCEYPYEPNGDICRLKSNEPCTDRYIPKNAGTHHFEENAKGNLECIIDTCILGFAEPENNKCDKCDSTHIKENGTCVKKQGKPCTDGITDKQTGNPVAQYECSSATCVCKVHSCGAEGYTPNSDRTKCIKESCSCGTVDMQTGYCTLDSRLNTTCDNATGATDATWQCKNNEVTCIPTKCDSNLHKTQPVDNKCVSKDGEKCNVDNAKSAHWKCADNECICIVDECIDGYGKSNQDTECKSKKCPCLQRWDNTQGRCVDLTETEKDCTASKQKQGATTAHLACDDGDKTSFAEICIIDTCDTAEYQETPNKDNRCVSKNNTQCDENGDEHADEQIFKKIDGKLKCVITKCEKGYLPSNDGNTPSSNGTSCIQSEGPCTDEQVQAIEHATKGELKRAVCYPTECNSGYEPSGKICKTLDGTKCSNPPRHATESYRTFDENGQEICHVVKCKDGYLPNKAEDETNATRCDPEKTYTPEELAQLEQDAKAAKEREQSFENRMLGGASIGAMGIGGMELAQGLAEQNADANAERRMTEYINTFKCEYASTQVDGNTTVNELPGANKLFDLYQEYQQLASNLKITKEALGMTPGIESEVILDKANTSLYDDAATGKTNGTYASLYRAVIDAESDDAKQINAQKSESKSKMTGGAIAAGSGAAAGVTGNVLLNKVDWNKTGKTNTATKTN